MSIAKTILKRGIVGLFSAMMALAVGCSSDNGPVPEPDGYQEAPSDAVSATEPMRGLNLTVFPSYSKLSDFVKENLVVAEGHVSSRYHVFKIETEYGTVHHLLLINPDAILSENVLYGFKTDGGLQKEFEVPACGGSFIVYWGMQHENAPEIRQVGGWYSGDEALARYTYDTLYTSGYPLDDWKEFADFSAEDKAAVMDAVQIGYSGQFVTELRIPENRTGERRRLFVTAQCWGQHDQYCYYDDDACPLSHDVRLLLPITQMP